MEYASRQASRRWLVKLLQKGNAYFHSYIRARTPWRGRRSSYSQLESPSPDMGLGIMKFEEQIKKASKSHMSMRIAMLYRSFYEYLQRGIDGFVEFLTISALPR